MTWRRVANSLAALGIVVSLAFLGATALTAQGDDVLIRIEGGSMMPTLEVGDVIAVQPGVTPQVGDVITYVYDRHRTTHRVTRSWTARDPSGTMRRLFRTKGDANRVEDHWVVTEDQLIGTMMPMSVAAAVAVSIEKNSTLLAMLFLPQLFAVIRAESAFLARQMRRTRPESDECPERESNPQDVSTRGV